MLYPIRCNRQLTQAKTDVYGVICSILLKIFGIWERDGIFPIVKIEVFYISNT